ncbi:TetR/AcrR family transcriptional regulator [Streptosporangium sp. NPDC002524]|uniref:TetR/AcrR family transcriptional regulator n=1 Tax=Streptosporangium sp. NPDC002524 TaxID=3154537 RepID=UPI00331C16B9
MSPRHRRGEETRERLLAAALDLYEREGADGFTMTAVTAASGVSVGSLYHHFGSFDGLAAALYARCLSGLLDAVVAALAALPPGEGTGPGEGAGAEGGEGTEAAEVEGGEGGKSSEGGEGGEGTEVEGGEGDKGGKGAEAGGREEAEAWVAAGIRAVVTGYLGFTREHRAAAHFVHASAYAAFLPAHAALVAKEKEPRLAGILGWLRPYAEAGLVVELPDTLTEMLVVGPAAETARRWLAGAPGIDLDEACRLLPERIWRSLRADVPP